GRPKRVLNMLRVFKVTSPMNIGSWLLSAYVPAAGTAALSALTGRLPRIGAAATAGAAATGPAVAAYTAALICDTAVPSWHDGYPEMPFVFTGSGAMAAGGLGLLGTSLLGTGVLRTSLFRTGLLGAGPLGSRLGTGVLRTGLLGAASRGPRLRASLGARLRASLGALRGAWPAEAVPARNLALLGAAMETAALERMRHRIGLTAEPYSNGRAGAYIKAGKILAAAGSAGAVLGTTRLLPPKGRRLAAALSGAALLAGSAATRWGIFHAGLASANDPKYTVIPQRRRRA
ncbi:MAG: hypothetical protein J2P26_11145, partial [Nocardiopsaceae bacterium]|nr:hypothetical protein [Nocardiopsaceae bacterium]